MYGSGVAHMSCAWYIMKELSFFLHNVLEAAGIGGLDIFLKDDGDTTVNHNANR